MAYMTRNLKNMGGIEQEYEDPGRCIPSIMASSWGSLLGILISVPLLGFWLEVQDPT